jgi:hypothetical protein
VTDGRLMDRRVVWLFVGVGMVVGGFVPVVWGGSALGLASFVFGSLGGVAGLWLAAKLT